MTRTPGPGPGRHRAPHPTPDLVLGARSLATFLLDVARHHRDDEAVVHLVAVGAPGQPAVLVVDADVVATAAALLREAS